MDGGEFYTRRFRDDNAAEFSPHYGGMSSGTSARHEDPKRHRVPSPSQDTVALNQEVNRVLALLETQRWEFDNLKEACADMRCEIEELKQEVTEKIELSSTVATRSFQQKLPTDLSVSEYF